MPEFSFCELGLRGCKDGSLGGVELKMNGEREREAHRGRLSVVVGYENKEMKKNLLCRMVVLCVELVGMCETERERQRKKRLAQLSVCVYVR